MTLNNLLLYSRKFLAQQLSEKFLSAANGNKLNEPQLDIMLNIRDPGTFSPKQDVKVNAERA